MRNTLEQMELIDKYIDGLLSPAETQQFENELLTDLELNAAVQNQMLLRQAAQQAAFRSMAKKAKSQYLIRKGLQWGLGVLAVLIIGYVTFNLISSPTAKSEKRDDHTQISTPLNTTGIETVKSLDEFGNPSTQTANNPDIVFPPMAVLGAAPIEEVNDPLPYQSFVLDPNKSNVLTTISGFVFAIASNTFASNDSVDVRIREAVTAEDIIMSGLSTVSDDKTLETAGMFEFYAYSHGQLLKINKPIIVTRGINKPAANMMLFDGMTRADGSINWVNPKPLRNDLPLVTLKSLDFVPIRFDETLKQIKGNVSLQLRDSVYYSFRPILKDAQSQAHSEAEYFYVDELPRNPGQFTMTNAYRISVSSSIEENSSAKFIDPAKIKALYAPEFARTIVATKAFEERLQYIHTTCDSRYIDTYMEHLDWSISRIDSLIYAQSKDARFAEFAARNDGGVNLDSEAALVLQEFYQKQASLHQKALTEAYKKHRQICDDLMGRYSKAQQIVLTQEENSKQNLFNEELTLNYNNASQQLGYPKRVTSGQRMASMSSRMNPEKTTSPKFTRVLPPPTPFRVTASFTTSGWKNIDQYLQESIVNRTDFKFKDKSGKTATINYSPSQVRILNKDQFQLVRCYYKPVEASSYVSVQSSGNGIYSYNLNELYNYKVICIGFDGKGWFYATSMIKANDNLEFYLAEIKRSKLSEELQALEESETNTLDNLESLVAAQRAWQSYNDRQWITEEQRTKLYSDVFPCIQTNNKETKRLNNILGGSLSTPLQEVSIGFNCDTLKIPIQPPPFKKTNQKRR
jgi:hypothetical protein